MELNTVDWIKFGVGLSFLVLQFWIFWRMQIALRIQRKVNLREIPTPIVERGWRLTTTHRVYIRLSHPFGAVFLSLGIMGTFVGMALGMMTIPSVAEALRSGGGDVDAVVLPFLIGLGISLSSSVLGITLALAAKAFWRSPEIEDWSTQKIKDKIGSYCGNVSRKFYSLDLDKPNPASVYSVLILCKAAQGRPDVVNHMVDDPAARFCNKVQDLLNNVRSSRATELAGDPLELSKVEHVERILDSIRSVCALRKPPSMVVEDAIPEPPLPADALVEPDKDDAEPPQEVESSDGVAEQEPPEKDGSEGTETAQSAADDDSGTAPHVAAAELPPAAENKPSRRKRA